MSETACTGCFEALDWRLAAMYERCRLCCRLDEIIVFRQLSKGEVKEIADIMLREVFVRADKKGIKIDVTERFKVRRGQLSMASYASCHLIC